MKATISTKTFLAIMSTVVKIVPRKTFKPIHENVLISAADSVLTLTATDGDTVIEAKVPAGEDCTVEKKGAIVIPARLLLEMLTQVQSDTVTVEDLGGTSVSIKWGDGHCVIPNFSSDNNGDDFPAVDSPYGEELQFPAHLLCSAITSVNYACAEDQVRPVICGVLFDAAPEGTTLVGTDAHRMAMCTIREVKAEKRTTFVLDLPLTNLLRSLCDKTETVSYSTNGNVSVFQAGEYTLKAKTNTGKFPDYRRIIPKENPNVLTIERSALVSAIKRIAACTARITNSIKFEIKPGLTGGEMEMSGQDIGYGITAREKMEVDYSGEDLIIAFNPDHFLEVAGKLPADNIKIKFAGPKNAVLMIPDTEDEKVETLSVIMPVMA